MDLKGFYQTAKKELEQLYGYKLLDLRLEQVERLNNPHGWNVVVSYLVENKNQSSTSVIASLPYERVYQAFVMSDNKEVKELRMFEKAS